MDHRSKVGGMWEEIGQLQFDFLVEHGLLPHHVLLDVGCGSLRGGRLFIDYLDPHRYVGLDKDEALVIAGMDKELDQDSKNIKQPIVFINDTFKIPEHIQADYAIAQSLFTHLDGDKIRACLIAVMDALQPLGKFYATFFQGPEGEMLFWQAGNIHSNWNADPYHYPYTFFLGLAEELGINMKYIGDWNHPRNQKMLEFTWKF